MKRSAFIAAAFILAFTAAGLFGFNVSAAKTGLSRTYVELAVGETASIKLIGAEKSIRWTMTDPDVCRYSKGIITATGEGTAYIYAESGGKRYKCTVKVDEKYRNSIYDTKTAETEKKADSSLNISTGKYGVLRVTKVSGKAKISADNGNVVSISSRSFNGGFDVIIGGKAEGTAYVTIQAGSAVTTVKVNVSGQTDSVWQGSFADTGSQEESISEEEYADEVIRLVNKEREAAGLPALEKDDSLTESAGIRVKETGRLFSHTRPNGKKCFTAINCDYYSAGENIAKGQRTPESAMNSWMHSPGHKSNILSRNFTHIGVAYDKETNCWVQMFIGR